ncbi:metal-sensitive transcriptional regulator [Ottowia sp.]|mgnify:CR=1 FL=1|uniref:metal-sensitive transcriptional regulator n=1 Tax=Ottowia sp. TaxID=1898956 RepID=UPI002606F3B9|nr:metal-sensitive transcriptional regulator [Ottowia sp.]
MNQMSDGAGKTAITARLARIEGQLRGVQRLIDEEVEVEQIAQQLTAARRALDKAFFAFVGSLVRQGKLTPDELAALLTRFG